MIVDKNLKIKDKSKEKSLDQEKIQQILSYKEKYSPEELKSIISLMENPLSKIIIKKILGL